MPNSITWRAGLDASDLKSGLASLAQAGQAAMGTVQSASEGATAAVGKVAAPVGSSASAMARLQRQADALRASVDPLAAAQVRFAQETDKANRLLEKGAIDADLHAKALAASRTRLDEATKALGDHSAATGLNRMQLLELSHVVRAVSDSVVAGANPLRVMAMEGGRVSQIMSSGSGGMAGSLAAIGRIMNPTAVAILAGSVALAGFTAAAYGASRADAELANSLQGLGAASGLTVEDLNRIAQATAAAGSGSVTLAREAEQAFLRAGVTSENMAKAVGLVERFAAVSGENAPEALKTMAEALKDPARGVEALGSGILNLSAEQIRHIRTLDEQGQRTAAVTALIDAIGGATDHARPHLTTLGEGFAHLTGQIAASIDMLGHFLDRVMHVPAAVKLANLERERAARGTIAEAGFDAAAGARAGALGAIPLIGPILAQPAMRKASNAELDAQIAALRREVGGAAGRAETAKVSKESREAQAIADRLNPMAAQIRDLRASVDGAKRALEHPVAGGPSAGELQEAIRKGELHLAELQKRWEPRAPRKRKGPADSTGSQDAGATRLGDAAGKDLAAAQLDAAQAAGRMAEAYTVEGRRAAAEADAELTRQAQRASIDAGLQAKLDGIAEAERRVRAAKADAHRAEQLQVLAAASATEKAAAEVRRRTADAQAQHAREKAARDALVSSLQEDLAQRKTIRAQYDAIDRIKASLAPEGATRTAAEARVLGNSQRDELAELAASFALQRAGVDGASLDGRQRLEELRSQEAAERASLNDRLAVERQQFAIGHLNPLAADAYRERNTDVLHEAATDAAQALHGFGADVVAAARQGRNAGEVLAAVPQKFADKFLGDMIDHYLTGPLEGWLGALLPQTAATTTMTTATSAATAALVALTASAQAATLAMGARGAGGGGFGSFFGDLFSGGGSLSGGSFIMPEAGMMASVGAGDAIPFFFRDGGRIPGFAGGSRALNGRVRGPGTATSDSILAVVDGRHPIAVSAGETIMNASASQRFGGVLEAMNRGALRGYADGGQIGMASEPAGPSHGGGGNVTIIDNRSGSDPAPSVKKTPGGDMIINLEKLAKRMIRGNPDAVRDAAFSAPPKVTRRGG